MRAVGRVVPNGAGFAPRVSFEEGIMAADVSEILAKLSTLEERMAGLIARIDVVTASAVTRHEMNDIERRVSSLEAASSRFVWIVLVAVLTALLSTVVKTSVMGGAMVMALLRLVIGAGVMGGAP